MEFDFISSFPPVTRVYLLLSFIINALCFSKIINGISLLLNLQLVVQHHNFWRLFSHLFYFGETNYTQRKKRKIEIQKRRFIYTYIRNKSVFIYIPSVG